MGFIEITKEKAELATSHSLYTSTATFRAKFRAMPIKNLTMLFHAGLAFLTVYLIVNNNRDFLTVDFELCHPPTHLLRLSTGL